MRPPLPRLLLLASVFAAAAPAAERPVDFNRDVRHILSDKCYHCHGQDAKNQKSEYRVDTREHALAKLDGGAAGIVPGHPEQSELSRRIHSRDPSEQMPPPNSNRSLTPEETRILDQWIREGAPYDKHWAFKPIPPAAAPAGPKLGRNTIDTFVGRRLQEEGLKASPEADRETLLRRVTMSLTGLQPTPAELAAFRADTSPDAYEKVVDRLLASDACAERSTLLWLDAARFADTDGYQTDAERSNWPWRDWVIKAFRENMPFDTFTIEQIAGDMLPNATPLQQLASTFNRNHRQNHEGGALAAEFFVENVIDRVETTSTVWLGLTMGCARCHDHKYDPLSQKEFFQLFAFFNNIGESGIGQGKDANPIMRTTSPLYEAPPELMQKLAAARERATAAEKEADKAFPAWVKTAAEPPADAKTSWAAADVTGAVVAPSGKLERLDDGSHRLAGKANNAEYSFTLKSAAPTAAVRLSALVDESFTKPRQLAASVNGNFVMTGAEIRVRDAAGKWAARTVKSVSATFEQDGYPVKNLIDGRSETGWAIYGTDPKPEPVSAVLVLAEPVPAGAEIELVLTHQSQFADHNAGRILLETTADPAAELKSGLKPDLLAALRAPANKRDKKQNKLLRDHFEENQPALVEARAHLRKLEEELRNLGLKEVPVMVMREKEGAPTPAYLLQRGQYDAPDKSEVLKRAVPAALFQGKPEDMPADRLGLARWLVARDNPLTARVIANRIWQQHFGMGLVKTSEDFGAQGEMPSHPELLDWLAARLMDHGWDLRALHREILTSATFRQVSRATADAHARDPENRLLARGPRFRMDGFAIRDLALNAAGLLNTTLGGPPVKPYQPDGLWTVVSGDPNTRYVPSAGAELYRKTLYTYWKRAVNPPGPIIFDAGGREVCNVNTRRTNTPLQALALMNDVTYIEAARHLAERALGSGTGTPERLSSLYRFATGREARSGTITVLNGNLEHFRKHFAAHEAEASAFLSHGESKRDARIATAEHAAWTAVAHLVLNMDEFITLE